MKTLSSPSIHASLVEIQQLVQDIDGLEHLGWCKVLPSGQYVIQGPWIWSQGWQNIMNALNYPADISIQNWKSTHGYRSEMDLNLGLMQSLDRWMEDPISTVYHILQSFPSKCKCWSSTTQIKCYQILTLNYHTAWTNYRPRLGCQYEASLRCVSCKLTVRTTVLEVLMQQLIDMSCDLKFRVVVVTFHELLCSSIHSMKKHNKSLPIRLLM